MLPLIAILGWIIRPLICACPQKSFNDPAESSEGHDSILAFSHFFGVVVKSISVELWTVVCFYPENAFLNCEKHFTLKGDFAFDFETNRKTIKIKGSIILISYNHQVVRIACHSYICILLELFANSTRTTKGNRVGSQDGSLFKWNHPPTRKLDTHKIR